MGERVVRHVIPYTPRHPAFVEYHRRKQRWASLNIHRRAGKTVATINDLIKRALMNRRQWPPPKYAYVAPFYNQAKRTAWGYLRHYADPVPDRLFIESDPKTLILPNRAEIRVFGADNPDALRGEYLDGVVADEFADWAPSVFPMVIRPMLADYNGWATFIGTPKGNNEFARQHREAEANPDRWFSLTLKASASGLLPEEEMADLRASMTPEQYEQELECSFDAAIIGAYYGKEIAEAERAGRIVQSLYDPALPVYTAWDLGIGDSTAIWFFQVYANELRVIDCYENHGQSLAHYVAVLESKPYKYGADYVPHDARVRELGTGRTRIETLTALGRKPELVPDHKVMDGINALRLSFGSIWFDRQCSDGLEALRQYRADFDEKTRAFKDKPRHDWTSHYADAARYMAMAWKEMRPAPRVALPPAWPAYAAQDITKATLNDLWASNDTGRRERI